MSKGTQVKIDPISWEMGFRDGWNASIPKTCPEGVLHEASYWQGVIEGKTAVPSRPIIYHQTKSGGLEGA